VWVTLLSGVDIVRPGKYKQVHKNAFVHVVRASRKRHDALYAHSSSLFGIPQSMTFEYIRRGRAIVHDSGEIVFHVHHDNPLPVWQLSDGHFVYRVSVGYCGFLLVGNYDDLHAF